MAWDPWAQSVEDIILPVVQDLPVQPTKVSIFEEGERKDTLYDFLSCIAIAQHLRIDLLPILWLPEVEVVGVGGTAEIRQATVNARVELAFKRLKLDRLGTFRSIYSEISILGQARIREHPNIVTLEGVCWDIDMSGSAVWPVLIFRKTNHGSLRKFVQSEACDNLSFDDVLSLLYDIAKGINCLHRCCKSNTTLLAFRQRSHGCSSDIIHGDITPDNVLVFDTVNGGYQAKVTDFGYSTLVCNEEPIFVEVHPPWTDPQYHGEQLDLLTAKSMDVYAFASVCLWLLTGKYTDSEVDRTFSTDETDASNSMNRSECLNVLSLVPELHTERCLSIQRLLSSCFLDISTDQGSSIEQLLSHLLEPR